MHHWQWNLNFQTKLKPEDSLRLLVLQQNSTAVSITSAMHRGFYRVQTDSEFSKNRFGVLRLRRVEVLRV